MRTFGGVAKKPVSAPAGKGSNRPLVGIVIDFQAAIVAVANKFAPLIQPILNGLSER